MRRGLRSVLRADSSLLVSGRSDVIRVLLAVVERRFDVHLATSYRIGQRVLGVVGLCLLLLYGIGGTAVVVAQTPERPSTAYRAVELQEGVRFGSAVAGVRDVSGDGRPDLVVGASHASSQGREEAGRAYLIDGQDGEILHRLRSPTPEERGYFGYSVAAVGDVDADGTPDVVVGAAGDSTNVGRAYLFSGSSGELLHSLSSPNPEEEGLFAKMLTGVGDVNGDGRPDILAGAIGETRAYLFSGTDGSRLRTFSSPTDADDHFGQVAAPGDVNGDGTPDLLVGASLASVDGRDGAGRVYLYDGSSGRRMQVFTEPTPTENGHFGYFVVGVGDVNEDDVPDVAVGAAEGPKAGGQVHVFSGADGDRLYTLSPPSPASDGFFGYSAVATGDATGDGTPDLLLGTRVPVPETDKPGRAYLFSGANGERVRTLAPVEDDHAGHFGVTVGRLPSSGTAAALLVGAPDATVDSTSKAGRVSQFSVQ